MIYPWALSRLVEPLDTFTRSHAQGALTYQLLGLVGFGLTYLLRNLPATVLGLQEVGREMMIGFFWVLYICAAILYLFGALGSAVQALGGYHYNFLGYKPDFQD